MLVPGVSGWLCEGISWTLPPQEKKEVKAFPSKAKARHWIRSLSPFTSSSSRSLSSSTREASKPGLRTEEMFVAQSSYMSQVICSFPCCSTNMQGDVYVHCLSHSPYANSRNFDPVAFQVCSSCVVSALIKVDERENWNIDGLFCTILLLAMVL